MLSSFPLDVSLLATDLNIAKDFYSDRLGLPIIMETADGVTFGCGGGSRLVVTKSTTGTADTQTQALWRVSDLAKEIIDLRQILLAGGRNGGDIFLEIRRRNDMVLRAHALRNCQKCAE